MSSLLTPISPGSFLPLELLLQHTALELQRTQGAVAALDFTESRAVPGSFCAKPCFHIILLQVLVTVEEGAIGGFAAHVLNFLTNEGLLDSGSLKFRSMMLPDRCGAISPACT